MRFASFALFALIVTGCSDPPEYDEAHVLDDTLDDTRSDAPPRGEIVPLVLDHAAVVGTADRPNAVVYVPDGYDPSHPAAIIFLHGFFNCASNVVKSANSSCGAGARNAYHLAAQLDAAQKNALIIVPELAYDRASSDPGALPEAGTFAAMLEDVSRELATPLPDYTIVASHSGGYRAAAAIARDAHVDELWLLDSLYGESSSFDAYVQAGPARFANIYTVGGGTLANSQAMVTRATSWVDSSQILDERGKRVLDDDDFAHELVFKQSGLSHDDVPRYYVGRLIETSGLAER